MAIGLFQFATSSVHLATALMLADEESVSHECHFYFWPNRTLAPNRMAADFSLGAISDYRFKKKASKSCDLVEFHSTFEKFYVDIKPFRQLLSIIDSSTDLIRLKSLDEIVPGLGSALANHLSSEPFLGKLPESKLRILLLQLIKSYIQVFRNVTQEIKNRSITKVYIYNGRFLHERATWEACKSLGVEVLLFENTRDRYHLSEFGFHNRVQNQLRIKNFWKTENYLTEDKLALAKSYFERLESAENPFYRGKPNTDLPEKFIAYFSNSDKEAIGFWDEWNQPFGDQLSALEMLAKCAHKIGLPLVIRMHPNSSSSDSIKSTQLSSLLHLSNVKLVSSSSPFSSYEIIRKSSGVITYGSTIGLEAAWNEIPCAVLADCKYDELGAAKKIDTQHEMLLWLQKVDKSPTLFDLYAQKMGAASWAFFVECGGQYLRNCVVVPGSWGAYKVSRYRTIGLESFRPLKYLNQFTLKSKQILFTFKYFSR